MSKKYSIPVPHVPDAVLGVGSLDVYAPLAGVRSRFRLSKPRSQEYLLGQLIGVGASHLSMFPEICSWLEQAEKLDWTKDVLVPKDVNSTDVQVANYGSFDAMYAAVVEPWLGKYDQLKEVYDQYRTGKLTRGEGAKVLALGAHGGARYAKSTDEQVRDTTNLKHSTDTKEYVEARLRRYDPELAARVDRGELSADTAAKQKGWRKPRPKLSRFEQIVKWLPSLTAKERRKLKGML